MTDAQRECGLTGHDWKRVDVTTFGSGGQREYIQVCRECGLQIAPPDRPDAA